jgi:hypothetical protein
MIVRTLPELARLDRVRLAVQSGMIGTSGNSRQSNRWHNE